MSSTTLIGLPGTMCTPAIFEPFAERIGRAVLPAAWLEWAPPHELADLGDRVGTLAAAHAPAVLIGHSTGGVLAMLAALRPDHPVTGLVLCGTGANTVGHGDIDAIIADVQHRWGPSLWQRIARRSVEAPLPGGLYRRLVDYPAGLDSAAVVAALRGQHRLDLTGVLPELELPVLVIHGRRDRARELDHAERLAALLPNAELLLLDCGHTAPAERPEEFAAAVDDWLRRNRLSAYRW